MRKYNPLDFQLLLALLLAFVVSADNKTNGPSSHIVLRHQSFGITFGQWMDLLTLCLAPLVTHIIVGVPTPIYLHHQRPKWHERIGHYNPTSILWRYFAITDRRVRAKSWNAADMGASNADFWTGEGWDGSEAMMRKSRVFCTRIPAGRHVELISATTAKTLIITLQGSQSIFDLAMGMIFEESNEYGYRVAINYLFFPLATVGLLRLLAAPWLTEDYAYAESNLIVHQDTLEANKDEDKATAITTRNLSRTISSMDLSESSSDSSGDIFYAPNSRRGITVRLIFIIFILGLWFTSIFYLLISPASFTATNFLLNLFYLILLSGELLIFSVHFYLGRSCTTIIPCVTSTWYKIYTCVLVLMVLALIIVAGLETRKTFCGKYTTYSKDFDDSICCPKQMHGPTPYWCTEIMKNARKKAATDL